MQDIEVKHLSSATEAIIPEKAPAKPFVFASPCIQIGFFWDAKVASGQTREVSYTSCWALIDTGADGVYVDHELIEKYGCPIATGGDKMVVNHREASTAHRGTLFVLEDRRCIDMWVMARDFKRENRPFSIVLGRRFLQFCQMTWNGPRKQVTLSIGSNGDAF